jgi:hypothetical protein
MSAENSKRTSRTMSSGSLAAALGIACVVAGLWFRFGRDEGETRDSSRPRETQVADGDESAPASSSTGTGSRRNATTDQARSRAKVTVTPDIIDLGTIAQCGGIARSSVSLTNTTAEPVKVVGWVVSCACIRMLDEPGFTIAARDSVEVPFEVDAWGIGGKSARLDFRLDGNAVGPRVRIDYSVGGPIRARPSVAIRPDRDQPMLIELERCDSDGAHVAEAFEVLSVFPPVGQIYRVSEGEPPLDAGWGGFDLDFAMIDELASAPDAAQDPNFEWKETPTGRRWKSLEIRVMTNHPECNELRLRVRNR